MEPDTNDGRSIEWPDGESTPSDEPVLRVIYTSISRLQGPVLAEMRRIRDQAGRHNGPDGIRVALLHKSGYFVQWAEGPPAAVDRLLERVTMDSRHHGLQVLHRSLGRRRLFRPWIGAIVQSDEVPAVMAARVRRMTRSGPGEAVNQEPAQVWAWLCAPPQPDMPRPGGAGLRVMLLSARGRHSFDLLRWVAEHYRRPIVSRRFAAAADDVPDVASDYLDLPHDDMPGGLRLVAHARQSLTMGVAHAFVPDHGAAVIRLDSDIERNRQLVQRLIGVCDQVQHRLPIVALGHPQSGQEDLAAQALSNGHEWVDVTVPTGLVSEADHWACLAPVLSRLAASRAG